MCRVSNLQISEPSLGIVEKFQHSLTLTNMKYNYAVLFFRHMFWLFSYAAKYIFSLTTIVNSVRID